MTVKQRLGAWLRRTLPIGSHLFLQLRFELNAVRAWLLNPFKFSENAKIRQLRRERDLLVNLGCGPFGLEGWVNIDLFRHPKITLRRDCRRSIPLADASCAGIHVEHFFEHLDPVNQAPVLLKDCLRCLEPEGVLRIIVPDAEAFLRAYLTPGWDAMRTLSPPGDNPELVFRTKMEVVNHTFLQDGEHYAGYDAETLEAVLREAGFSRVRRCSWGEGDFPGGCIDREQHRPYSLYMEARP